MAELGFAAERQDLQGWFQQREVAGFGARVVQHGCGHLDGVLLPDR